MRRFQRPAIREGGRRELEGVGEQVHEDPMNLLEVHLSEERLRRPNREGHAPVVGQLLEVRRRPLRAA